MSSLIRLSNGELLQARSWSDAIMSRPNIKAKPNYTGIAAEDRFYFGFLGEIAFARWLEQIGARYVWRVSLEGRSETPEFTVFVDDKLVTIDVKTASKPRHEKMMQPHSQECDADLYVGAKVFDGEWVQLHGWTDRETLANVPPAEFGHGPTRAIQLEALIGLEHLAPKLGTRLVVEGAT